jgi:hypothetical protein
MKKKAILIFVSIFILGFLVGDFESKEFKKKVKNFKIRFLLKQNVDLNQKENLNKQKKIKANSYDLEVKELISFDIVSDFGLPGHVLRTAGFQIDKDKEKYDYKIFLQDGQLIKTEGIFKTNLPKSVVYEDAEEFRDIVSGGLKSTFTLQDKNFGIISNNKSGCNYLSIVELGKKKILLEGECLPDDEDLDFNGSGGAYFFEGENLYITIGIPTATGEKTSMLAQDEKSIYGKILKINKRELLKNDNEKIQYEIFSMGHRNPQGLLKINDKIFSTEHGPQGGDEINLIKEKGNYGWPLESYGTRYGDGESFNKKETEKIFVKPIFSFLPSIAPSSLGKCPKNLSNFYKSNICLISLSLREQALFVILLEKENNRIQNIEKIKLSKRMRHFGTKSNGDIFFDDNSFFVSTDDLTILEIKFINFR